MSKEYHSFLICHHGDKADIYVNGLPIGVVNFAHPFAQFEPHQFVMPDGTLKAVKLPPELGDIDGFKAQLMDIISIIDL
jgi:hypothetical protein